MKKLTILIALLLVCSFVGCKSSKPRETENPGVQATTPKEAENKDTQPTAPEEHEPFSITKADLGYIYRIYNNNVLVEEEYVARKEPTCLYLTDSLIHVTVQAGTGRSTNWGFFYDYTTNKRSETFKHILGYTESLVATGRADRVIIQSIFDDSYYLEIADFEQPVAQIAADAMQDVDFSEDMTTVTVTYIVEGSYDRATQTYSLTNCPAQYEEVLKDYQKIVQYRLSEDFLLSENLSALQQQLTSGLFYDAHETDSETPSVQTKWTYMVVDMPDYISQPEVDSFGYILKDLDGDSSPELIWVSADYKMIFAIFTISDNKAVLVDAYWPRYRAVISDSGTVYTYGSGGASTFEYTCWTLHKGQQEYKNIQMQFGCNIGQYYEVIENAPVEISKDRFDALLTEHPFEAGSTWKNNILHLLHSA